TDYFVVQRSIDGGVSWQTVRGGSRLLPDNDADAVIFDHEVPNGAEAWYRASAITDDAGVIIASPWSAPASASWSSRDWWLKAPAVRSLNCRVRFAQDGIPQLGRRRPQGRFDVLGRTTPIVVSDVRKSVEGEATPLTL